MGCVLPQNEESQQIGHFFVCLFARVYLQFVFSSFILALALFLSLSLTLPSAYVCTVHCVCGCLFAVFECCMQKPNMNNTF